ncbi:MAG: PQQ-binding-like beta-propeller repeat protein [Actinomycetota bacterium]
MDSTRSRRWLVPAAVLILVLIVSAFSAGCGSKEKTSGRDSGKTSEGGSGLVWPTVYRNDQRDGRSAVNGPQAPDVLWTFEGGTRTYSWAVLTADGDVVAGFEGKVVAVKPSDGTVSWEFSTGGARATTCCVGPDGTVYVGAGTGIFALGPDGTRKWSYDLGSTADEPSVGPDGRVYAGSVGGRLVCLSRGGKLEWETSVPGSIRSPSFDGKGNLYCSAATLCMYAFDSKGTRKWEFKPEGDLPVYPALFEWANTLDTPSIGSDGTVYAGSYNTPNMTTSGTQIPGYAVPPRAKVYAITPAGQKKWEFAGNYEGLSTLHSPSIGADGTLYSGTSCWRVLAIEPAGGSLKWEFNTGEGQGVCPSVWSPSIGKDGLLYAATTSAKVFCITPEGTEKWRFGGPAAWLPDYAGSNGFTPPPINEDGVLFSVLSEGKIYAFKAAGP